MSESNGDEDEPTTVHFIDGTAEAYNIVVRPYGSEWLYALRPGTAANHCILNTENVTRIEAQTVARLEKGVGYCDFDRRDGIETFVKQENWIVLENNDNWLLSLIVRISNPLDAHTSGAKMAVLPDLSLA